MYELQFATPSAWVDAVMADFDAFLLDHATAEKKASSMAMSMVSHYPDKPELIKAMIDLAIEELSHFREVSQLIYQQGLQLISDIKDPYVNEFRKAVRQGKEVYLLDRLLIASIVEARGHERFGLIAEALPEGRMKKFYAAITRSEGRHYELFLELAYRYIDKPTVDERLNELLRFEAKIVENLPIRAALH